MAQSGSALDWGSRGRRFKSYRSDQIFCNINNGIAGFPNFLNRVRQDVRWR